MAQSRIIILTDQHGQQLGAQLQAILQRENAYRVDVWRAHCSTGQRAWNPILT